MKAAVPLICLSSTNLTCHWLQIGHAICVTEGPVSSPLQTLVLLKRLSLPLCPSARVQAFFMRPPALWHAFHCLHASPPLWILPHAPEIAHCPEPSRLGTLMAMTITRG